MAKQVIQKMFVGVITDEMKAQGWKKNELSKELVPEQTIEVKQPDGSLFIITKSNFFEIIDFVLPEIQQGTYCTAIDHATATVERIGSEYFDSPVSINAVIDHIREALNLLKNN